jgi:hypothetical protein
MELQNIKLTEIPGRISLAPVSPARSRWTRRSNGSAPTARYSNPVRAAGSSRISVVSLTQRLSGEESVPSMEVSKHCLRPSCIRRDHQRLRVEEGDQDVYQVDRIVG